nr:hypothetical protein [Nitrospinaceae bacterium]NIR53488.1 hypothetical protein [Nitrospinaceae bacterium]NIS83885.1 hypothetical protein [Nitrospinaceae bacterium]NIT80685.1 hypothetical protein [Nitrospinaceae bacterium]NIU43004.1 hypothetical protein [Nitrospinaceae bacterium]
EHYLPVKNQGALLTGEDLIERFQLNPSPLFRTILERVEEGRVLGTIRSREDAEELARSIIQTH